MANAIAAATLDFLRWWGTELRGLLPDRLFAPFARYQRRLVLSVESGRYRVIAERGTQLEELSPAADAIEDALLLLADAAKTRPGIPVGLRFGPADCFARALQLPAAAERDFTRILDLDLERTTPFRRDDVLAAHYIDRAALAAPGKRSVRQVLVRRRTVDELTARMRELGLAPAFADCWNEARSAALPVDLLASATARRAPCGVGTNLAPAIAIAAAALFASALAVHIVRHQSALAALEAEVAAARAEAQKVRVAFDATETVHKQVAALQRLARERISAAHVLDELTNVLPDSAWVYDLRLDAQSVEFTGFARSAAGLIPLLERSKMFTAATLTSPVVLDGGEDKERFSIRARLRDAPEPKPDTATPEPEGGAL